jgi:intracellular sulfur oxidation DsrE/DsrF family protein
MRYLGWVCAILLGCSVLANTAQAKDDIHIDIPVTLTEAKIVFNLDHPAFTGAEPTGLFFLRLMIERFKAEHTKATLVAIFHGANAHMLLNDQTYNQTQNWDGGNPFKEQIEALIREGVSIEECAESMRLNHWTNADLIPGAKVNTGANFRVVSLVQQGFVQIQP